MKIITTESRLHPNEDYSERDHAKISLLKSLIRLSIREYLEQLPGIAANEVNIAEVGTWLNITTYEVPELTTDWGNELVYMFHVEKVRNTPHEKSWEFFIEMTNERVLTERIQERFSKYLAAAGEGDYMEEFRSVTQMNSTLFYTYIAVK